MKIAVITGASSGLGTEYVFAVSRLRKDIDEIWMIARRRERLDQLVGQLSAKVRVLPLDITKDECTAEYSALLAELNPEVALLINNAGFGKLGNFDTLETEDCAGMVRLNCEALTVITSLTLPFMKAGGEIINTCSIASFCPNTRMAVYSSTKAYVMSLSRALRYELKGRKINCLAVCPGPMDTEFLKVADIAPGSSSAFDTLPRVNPRIMAEKSLAASAKHRAVYTNKAIYKIYRVLAKLLPHSLIMKISGT